jgi:hypothetical protein
MSGWIKIHRSITSHWLYTEKRIFSRLEAWNDILLTVNYTDNQVSIKGKVYNVKRGESVLSIDSWGKRWGWDKSKTRRFLTLLQSENMVVTNSDTITTHLTVCNYDTYQDIGNADETQMKRKRNADEFQTTPIKERKKERSEEIKNSILSFDEFWELYPNKVGKTKCKPMFDKLSETDKDKIKGSIKRFTEYKPFSTYNHPNPSTYLNQKRWEDEIPTVAQAETFKITFPR